MDRSVIGRLVRDVPGVWQYAIGNLACDADGTLWLDRSEDEIPRAYLAADLSAFRQLCALHCAASELAFVRRSEQHKYHKSNEAFVAWARQNDPLVFEDEGSYWNEMANPDM